MRRGFEAQLTALRKRVEVTSLRGLAGAAAALLGGHPASVCHVLATWEQMRLGDLPQLTLWYWETLAPLGVHLPAGPAARLLHGLLAGHYAETQIVLDALRDCRDRAEHMVGYPRLPEGGDEPVTELWRRALVTAGDDFWALTADICARVRPILLTGNRDEVVRVLQIERGTLRPSIERLEVLAHRVAGSDRPPVLSPAQPAPPAPLAPPAPEPQVDALLPVAGPPLDPPAVAGRALLRGEARRARLRRWLPIGFLVLVTGLALAVLTTVWYGWPGLGG